MNNIQELKEEKSFYEALATKDKLVVVDFYATWHPPCSQMNSVIDEIAKDHSSSLFFKVDVDKFPSIAEKYPIQSVPAFVFICNNKVIDALEGANPPELAAKTTKLARVVANNAVVSSGAVSATEPSQNLNERLKKLVNAAPVMIFIKGTPKAPRCGFTRKFVEILDNANIRYQSFDILSDETVRQGLKEYSNWPTYPQLYINGELIGGLDVVKELLESGELMDMIPDSAKAASEAEKKTDLNERLKQLINKQRIMIFMKGTPDSPRCGFSARAVEILKSTGTEFGYFDILTDEEVRQGLKDYSDWKTYPQIYIDGELVGGVDILTELKENGELMDMIQKK